MIIRCASTNSGKVREFHMAAAHFGYPEIDIQLLENMKSIPPAVEDGESFDENAIKKALHYSKHTDDLVFADDSGLEVDALDGAPGVLSARYSPEGTDEANNRLLIENLRDQDDRIALLGSNGNGRHPVRAESTVLFPAIVLAGIGASFW